jgi:hypothetical protein
LSHEKLEIVSFCESSVSPAKGSRGGSGNSTLRVDCPRPPKILESLFRDSIVCGPQLLLFNEVLNFSASPQTCREDMVFALTAMSISSISLVANALGLR